MLKGAIIGFGEVAQNGHLPAYQASDQTQIVAVVDRTATRRQAAQESVPGVVAFSSIDELIANVALDFVDICTPPALHGDPIRRALAHRLNVVCEKPLLLDQTELETIRVLARDANRVVIPVHNWKYAPIIKRGTELLRSGAIGKLHHVEIETLRLKDCAVADPDHPNWRRDPAISGGGILMDHGWHAIYLANHWFEENLIDIHASLHRTGPDNIEDQVELTLIFPSGNTKIFLTWRADKRRNAMRLSGETGEILIDDGILRIGDQSEKFASTLSAGSHHSDWFTAMLPDIVASFSCPEMAAKSFDEAALCLAVIQRAYQ